MDRPRTWRRRTRLTLEPADNPCEMARDPDLSVVIPTYRRPGKLAACLRRLSRQTLERDRYEVLVGLDGPDEASVEAARGAWRGDPGRLLVETCERRGLNATRNRLLEGARGRVLVSMNDDVLPEPGFLEAHLGAHERAASRDETVIVTGDSPWVVREPDRLFDRLIRETPMVFFYPLMRNEDPERDWGYRCAWGLNSSMRLDQVRAVGGWTAFPLAYGYDDIELAWRLARDFGASVRYVREARAAHDHRMEPASYLERERKLGRSAYHFARLNPGFTLDLFGRDVTSSGELAYAREYVDRERTTSERARERFLGLAALPAAAIDGPEAAQLAMLLYQQHVPLKRWEWRLGLLEGAEGAGEVAEAADGRSSTGPEREGSRSADAA